MPSDGPQVAVPEAAPDQGCNPGDVLEGGVALDGIKAPRDEPVGGPEIMVLTRVPIEAVPVRQWRVWIYT